MDQGLRSMITLTLIIAVATIALSATYVSTKDVIEENRDKEFLSMVHLIFPQTERIVSHDIYKEGDAVGEYYSAYDRRDQAIGYIVIEEVSGYQSRIRLVVGFDQDKTLKSVMILEQYETPGIGSKITEQEFLDQFRGKDIEELHLKNRGGSIDGISSATVSSQAVITGVRQSVEIMR